MQYSTTKDFIQESQKAYEKKLNSIFVESISRVKNFYYNRGLANLNSYGIQEALSKKDQKRLIYLSKDRWNILSHENRFLISMVFFDKNNNIITYLGEKPNIKKLTKRSTFTYEKKLNYRIVIPSKQNNGYLVFLIDPKYFLSEIYHLANIESYIISKDNSLLISRKNFKDLSLLKYLKKDNNSKTFNINSKIFITHHIDMEKIDGKNSFKILFFQDITSSQERLTQTVFKSFILISILGTVLLIVLHYGFKVLIVRLEQSQEKLSSLNKNLEKRVKEEVALKTKKEEEAKEKERILIHQSKLASMGEMIGSIAHQWRQPLTQLSSILVLIELMFEKGKLKKEDLRDSIKEAEEQINFMSKTIDDFRNFFKPDKKKKLFSPKKSIKKSLCLISSSLENNHIKTEVEYSNEKQIDGYENEFSQVILNILSNAKDILIEKKITNPKITIKLDIYENRSRIKICDNAGGIKITPIEKVFEPYVSTKHASSGTGIGLYMSKNIIEKSMNGSLTVSNIDEGACFTIIL